MNSAKSYPSFESGALRAVYAFHPPLGIYHLLKKRPCLLYAKDYRTLTVLVCTSQPPTKYSHRFSPFNYAPRLHGQPPAILHSANNPESAGAGYIFFTHALVGRLVEKKYALTDFRGPGGIVISHFDSATGDSWVPKTNYRLSTAQMKYIEELNCKFWQGVRYDEHGGEAPHVTQKVPIRRTAGLKDEVLDTSHLPPMTGREKMLALKRATRIRQIKKEKRMTKIKLWESMLEVARAHGSEAPKRKRRRGKRGTAMGVSRRANPAEVQRLEAARGLQEWKKRQIKRKGRKDVFKRKSKGLIDAPVMRVNGMPNKRDLMRGESREVAEWNIPETRSGNIRVEWPRKKLVRRAFVEPASRAAERGDFPRSQVGLPMGWTRHRGIDKIDDDRGGKGHSGW